MAEAPVFAGFLEHYDSTTHVLPLIPVQLLLEGHIGTLADVLTELESDRPVQHQDRMLWGLYGMLRNFTEEAQRRAIRLRNAGLYWKRDLDDRNDESLFPDLPPPRKHDLHGETCVR